MIVNVGSSNRTKVDAVALAFREHARFEDADVRGIAVQVPEFGHPKTLAETVEGAMERAKMAFRECLYSLGIEGGLMDVPHSKTHHMEVAACAIFDGEQCHLGLSPACEWPKAALRGILDKGLDGSQALKEAGLTDHEKIGTASGMISLLTDGRMDRTAYNKIAVQMALTHLLHPELY